MFGIGYSELLVIAILGLVLIGPKDLPRVMREVGRWVGKAQGMARHFRSGIDTMIREAELEEMEKKWREENERIMKLYPANAHYPEPGQPDEMPPVADAPRPPNEEKPAEDKSGDELPPEQRPLP